MDANMVTSIESREELSGIIENIYSDHEETGCKTVSPQKIDKLGSGLSRGLSQTL
jgi:hypothetical protein